MDIDELERWKETEYAYRMRHSGREIPDAIFYAPPEIQHQMSVAYDAQDDAQIGKLVVKALGIWIANQVDEESGYYADRMDDSERRNRVCSV